MSRIRTIKPEYWGHPKTARLSRDARLLFLGLLNESDDYGRQLGAVKRIAGAIFPNDEDVSARLVTKWLDELEREEMIERYTHDGVDYLLICGFTDHQRVSHPSPSRLPPPPSGNIPEGFGNDSGTTPAPLAPDLGSGSRNMDLGSGNGSDAAQHSREEPEPNPGAVHDILGRLNARKASA